MIKGELTREKLVAATAELLQRQGYHGTGLREIVAESGAPRGSVYFHFPGGKDELACAALDAAGAAWRGRIEAVIARSSDLGAAVESVCELLADELEASAFERGCPVAAVALENPSPAVRDAIREHYDAWTRAIAARAGSREIAVFVLAAVEGAMVLAKASRTTEPLRSVGRTLRALAGRLGTGR